jgi:hypothetical protein
VAQRADRFDEMLNGSTLPVVRDWRENRQLAMARQSPSPDASGGAGEACEAGADTVD